MRLFDEGEGNRIYSGTVTAFLPADHDDPADEGDCLEVTFDDGRDAETKVQVYRVDDILMDLLPADTPERLPGVAYGTVFWYKMKAMYELMRQSVMEDTFSGTNDELVRAAYSLGIRENYDAAALNRKLRSSLSRHLHPDKMQHARNPLRARHLARLIYDGLRYLKEDLEHAERRRDPDFAPSVDAPTPESWPEYMSEDFATAAGAETETFTPPEQTPGLRRNTGQGGGGRDTGTMWAGDEGAAWCPEGEDVPGVDPEVDGEQACMAWRMNWDA